MQEEKNIVKTICYGFVSGDGICGAASEIKEQAVRWIIYPFYVCYSGIM